MIIITRGTTPTIVAELPETIDLTQAAEIQLTLKQRPKELVKTLSAGEVTVSGNLVSASFSQTETLSFKADGAAVQIRILLNDGTALASTIESVLVLPVLKGGVISNA